MNNGVKQRLVGAIVLVCLALILWPVVFSGPDNMVLDKQSQIPPRPIFEKYTVPAPARVDDVEPVADAFMPHVATDTTPDATPETTPNTVPETIPAKPDPSPKQTIPPKQQSAEPESFPKPGLDDRQLPIAWVLQVASFGQQSNAEEFTQKLQKGGYKAFTQNIPGKEGSTTRVYVGPSLNKADLDEDRIGINEAFKVNSIIVRFEQ